MVDPVVAPIRKISEKERRNVSRVGERKFWHGRRFRIIGRVDNAIILPL